MTKHKLRPQTAQDEHDEQFLASREAGVQLGSRQQLDDLIQSSGGTALGSSSAASSPKTGLLESVMERHGFTEAQALKALKDFGA